MRPISVKSTDCSHCHSAIDEFHFLPLAVSGAGSEVVLLLARSETPSPHSSLLAVT